MRMRIFCLVASLTGFWWALTLVRADEPPDGPNRLFQDEFVDNLVGDWHLTREIRGQRVASTFRAEWVLNHQFLQLHFKDVVESGGYEAIVLLGYQHADKRYVAHWCDTYGGKFSGVGLGQRSGDTIPFEFHYPDGPFFNTFAWNPETKGWTFTMESVGQDGKRKLFAVDRLRRK